MLGREKELAELERLFAQAAGGSGGGLLIAGPAGIGKSTLLDVAIARAQAAGTQVLAARGGELERDLAFGIVRQLFERALSSLRRPAAARVSAGAAGLAAEVLNSAPAAASPVRTQAADEPSLIHSLYWLCSNLAERRPLLLAVDDVQWADASSQRWLAYLSERLDGLPILLVMTWRIGEAGAAERMLDALAASARVTETRPGPLDEGAVAQLVRRHLGEGADAGFCRALYEAGQGNPFLTVELIAASAAAQMAPTAASAGWVRTLGPESVARDVLRRIDRLGTAATSIARAVAILGTKVEVGQAAELAGLSRAEAAAAADVLAKARVLRAERPLEFIHPVVRSVVYQDIPLGERAQGHRQAARLLAHRQDLQASAMHLLSTEAGGDAWVVDTLRAAAAAAPAHESAATYLRRALAEPPAPEKRLDLLLELGRAEEASLDPHAVEHLAEAHELTADPVSRARAGRALAGALFWAGQTEEAERSYAEAIEELRAGGAHADGEGRELHLLLESDLHWARQESGRLPPSTFERLLELVRDMPLGSATAGERAVYAHLAYLGPFSGATPAEVAEFGRRARHGGRPADALDDARSFYSGIFGLEFADQLELAERLEAEALAEARSRGSLSGIAFASMALAILGCRRGALGMAEEKARSAIEIARNEGLDWLPPLAGGALADALIERGELEEADRVMAETEISHGENGDLSSAAFHRYVRARVRLAQGRADDALEDFVHAGQLMRRSSHDHPAYYPWRSGAALAHLALGRRDASRELVAVELEMARAFGAPRSLGASLRTAGLVEGGQRGLSLLREAVDVLQDSPAELERARAIVELGSALRRAGERTEGAASLRAGLELADRCGGLVLAERARRELRMLGARPRRAATSGVEALTPSESEVVRLAAEGLSDREIAQRLVVSPRTVENHLGRAYRKLGISSRRQLPGALRVPGQS